MSEGLPILEETFRQGLGNWWVEGGEEVLARDGRLYMRAEGACPEEGSVCTAWCRTPHPADFKLELEAQVLPESKGDSNNINLFFCYSDPCGRPLFESRAERRTAAYESYHQLNGHIVTFLNGAAEGGSRTQARIRIRRCPGFGLLAETFAYHSSKGHTYRLQVRKQGGAVSFAVDGQPLLEALDPNPPGGGLLGLRTFKTWLWWSEVRLFSLERLSQ